jgi:hypothetical protein
MNYKDLLTLFIILSMLLFTGLRVAEQGLNITMGLNLKPRVFNFHIINPRGYDIWFLGKHISLQKIIKIADFYADKKNIRLIWQGNSYYITPLISFTPPLESLNLDKNPR